MDPALRELIVQGHPTDAVAVVVRLQERAEPPAILRLRARFGTVATALVTRGDLPALHDDPAIASVKPSRLYGRELEAIHDDLRTPDAPAAAPIPDHRPPGLFETGRGSIVCAIDWGIDYAHPDFRAPDGSTRLLALWDQRVPAGRAARPGPYGYGAVHERADIDRALLSPDPFAALGYRPAARSHGSHVLGIAAGNGAAGGPAGVAPDADLLFVHMGSAGEDLGGSIELLEAIDFAVRRAGNAPLAINLSIGACAGPHDASLLVERAIDWILLHRPATAIVQSTGNYYSRDVHMRGRLREDRRAGLPFRVVPHPASPVSVEVWYPGADVFAATATAPDGTVSIAALGEAAPLRLADGPELGVLYHRAADPNNGDNLVNLVLRPNTPPGDWTLAITGVDVVDGRWHAWIERDSACPRCQARFAADRADPACSTGSICNALRTVTVGAYDAHDPARAVPPFSSVGPTRDGRRKPLLAAPGVRVVSVCSRRDPADPPGYVSMSGTSMSAPHVTGTFALMMQAAGRQRIGALRRALFASLDTDGPSEPRRGYGVLDIAAAAAAARRLPPVPVLPGPGEAVPPDDIPFPTMERPMTDAQATRAPILRDPPGTLPDPVSDLSVLLRRALDPGEPDATVVGWRGRRLDRPLRSGDLLLRDGRAGPALLGIVADPLLLDLAATRRQGLIPVDGLPGRYVRIDEPGNASGIGLARRVTGPDGLMLPDRVLLRRQTAPVPPGGDDPGPRPEPSPGFPAIRIGSTGPAVAEAQSRLDLVHARLGSVGQPGLPGCPLAIDGRFGPATAAAILGFQRLAFPDDPADWDGIVGPRTWAALGRAAFPPVPFPSPTARPDPEADAERTPDPVPCAAVLSSRALLRRSADLSAGRRPRPQLAADPATGGTSPACPGQLDLSRTGPTGGTTDLLLWNFDIDGSYLKRQHEAALDRLVVELHDLVRGGRTPVVVHLSGFASRTGDLAHNVPLATDRENSVEQYLRDHLEDATPIPELPVAPMVSFRANPSGFDMSSPPDTENPRARSVRVIAVPQGSPIPPPLVVPPTPVPVPPLPTPFVPPVIPPVVPPFVPPVVPPVFPPPGQPDPTDPPAQRACSPFLPERASKDYLDYLRPETTGLAELLINGRSSGGTGPDRDSTEPLDRMQQAVSALEAGDACYLSAWIFEAATPLTAGPAGAARDWGALLAARAEAGVRIRILMTDFDPILGAWAAQVDALAVGPLDALIAALPPAARDNLKYVVSMHPVQAGALRSGLATGLQSGVATRSSINVASHHQKFMLCRRGGAITAFCGGLDIESRKTPAKWSYNGLAGWHDLHLRLTGPVTRDLEREFVMRWNREKAHSRRRARPGWHGYEALSPTPLAAAERRIARHRLQMTRTVSEDATFSLYNTRRDDVRRSYQRIIGCAERFLYLENQYFKSPDLADWIVSRGREKPALIVILIVLADLSLDDGANPVTALGTNLQFRTLDRIMSGLGPSRVRFYTMTGRSVHAKLVMADDAALSVGSANASVRSFEMDSELNVTIGDPGAARSFRTRLWAHNLGQPHAAVASWADTDFLARWDTVARANAAVPPPDMAGEGIVPYDHTTHKGSGSSLIPDAIARVDVGPDPAFPGVA